MARTYRQKPKSQPPITRRYSARFDRDRPIDIGLLSKAFVELARAMAEHDAQLAVEPRKKASHEKTA
jgi:hypothetical protein